MVFAFLPTAFLTLGAFLLVCVSGYLGFKGGESYIEISFCLILVAWAAATMAVMGSHKLYYADLKKLDLDFDKWYRHQRKIASRCFGKTKFVVLNNTTAFCLFSERLEEGKRELERLRRFVDKHPSPETIFFCLSLELELMEKSIDLSGADQIFQQMYNILNSPGMPGGALRTRFISGFEYARAEVEFYKRTPEMLRGSDINITKQFIAASERRIADINGVNSQMGYLFLAYHYNIGLCYALLGDYHNASVHLRLVADSEHSYPLIKRARRHLETGDISILFSMMP